MQLGRGGGVDHYQHYVMNSAMWIDGASVWKRFLGKSRVMAQHWLCLSHPWSFWWENNHSPSCDCLVGPFPCHIIACKIAAHRVKILNRIALQSLIHSWDKVQIRSNPLDNTVLTVWCGKCQLAFKWKHIFASYIIQSLFFYPLFLSLLAKYES